MGDVVEDRVAALGYVLGHERAGARPVTTDHRLDDQAVERVGAFELGGAEGLERLEHERYVDGAVQHRGETTVTRRVEDAVVDTAVEFVDAAHAVDGPGVLGFARRAERLS